MPSVIAHYQEIALKGKNRNWFLRRLVRNVREALAGLSVRDIRTPMGRIDIVFDREQDWPELRQRLTRVFGIANFSLARRAPLDLEAIGDAIVRDLPDESVASFRIAVRRADKRFPIPSPEIERLIGRRVQDARGWKVDLTRPALIIWIELVPGEAFYHFGKLPGPGGLPVGSSGRVVVLLSGGIDSPVAAWRMIRRGCRATFVHFHSYPFLSRTSQEKARELAALLTRYQLRSRLYLVPFGELQRQITLSVAGPLRVVVYRRMMLRIAEQIALQSRAQALVTGEVVGQVASQTLDNMTIITAAAHLPVLRPLVGMDKEEIITEATRLGTYPVSIIPDEDCCTLFTPRHPVTRAHPRVIEVAESTLPIADLVGESLAHMVLERYSYPPAAGPISAAASVEERW
jgi:thiamine biosynthesis protein ThiI